MTTKPFPITPAVRVLRKNRIDFEPHLYSYEHHGGAGQAALALDLPPFAVVKTLVMEMDAKTPVLILMHGNRQVSTKQLARQAGVKRVQAIDTAAAEKVTGYKTGGISPFGTRKTMLIFAETSIFELERIFINGGKRGFLVAMTPADLQKILKIQKVQVAIKES
jgi:Cys-tRNA(Pro) deacylase